MNKLGYQNIYYRKGSYVVEKCINRVRFRVGTFKNLKQAVKARDSFRKTYEDYCGLNQ